MTTPICTIDSTGIHQPTLADCLAYLNTGFQGVWGQDIYIDPDSQDGQQIGIFASAYDDMNSMAVAVYGSFRPDNAQGAALSSLVKINGVRRDVPTNSTVSLAITGTVGTIINNGVVADLNNNTWALPAQVIIPPSGTITVAATCETSGEIIAEANTIIKIATPVGGWQTVNNPTAAAVGEPVENDGQLRIRRDVSTELPSRSNPTGIEGGMLALPGVTACKVWENDTNVTDEHGIPPHSVAVVVLGGNDDDIVALLAAKKGDGCGTYGTSQMDLYDPYGVKHTYYYSRPNQILITGIITIRPTQSYSSDVLTNIQTNLANWVTALGIGDSFAATDSITIMAPSRAAGFHVVFATFARDGGMPTALYIPIAFDEMAVALPAYFNVTLASS